MSSGHLKTADSHSFNKKRIFQNELEKYQELLNELERPLIFLLILLLAT